MCFDECPALPASDDEVARAMRLSMRWAERSKDAFGDRPGHALFGIQQGGVTHELRAESAEALKASASTAMRSAGSPWARGRRRCSACWTMRPTCCPGQTALPDGRGQARRHRRRRGARVDMMDCVLPSRSGRTGQAFTRRGVVNIKNARHADDPRPLDEECTCPACRGYSRAYLHHVFRRVRRDHRVDAADLAQPALLSGGLWQWTGTPVCARWRSRRTPRMRAFRGGWKIPCRTRADGDIERL
jgi:queuine tRNA-ribosyltransferase